MGKKGSPAPKIVKPKKKKKKGPKFKKVPSQSL